MIAQSQAGIGMAMAGPCTVWKPAAWRVIWVKLDGMRSAKTLLTCDPTTSMCAPMGVAGWLCWSEHSPARLPRQTREGETPCHLLRLATGASPEQVPL